MGMKVEGVKISESLCDICKKKERKEKKSGTECLALLERLDEWWKVGAAGGCKTGLTWTSFSAA